MTLLPGSSGPLLRGRPALQFSTCPAGGKARTKPVGHPQPATRIPSLAHPWGEAGLRGWRVGPAGWGRPCGSWRRSCQCASRAGICPGATPSSRCVPPGQAPASLALPNAGTPSPAQAAPGLPVDRASASQAPHPSSRSRSCHPGGNQAPSSQSCPRPMGPWDLGSRHLDLGED